MRRKKLGELLHEQGKISADDLSKAIYDQTGKAIRLGELLLTRGLVHKFDLLLALEEVVGIAYQDCSKIPPTAEALQRIPRVIAERCRALPMEQNGMRLTVVMAEPQNLNLVNELRFASGLEIVPLLGFTSEIQDAITKYYGASEAPKPAEQEQEQEEEQESPQGDTAEREDSAAAEMQFVSTSSRQANHEAIEEVQAELSHRRTPAVRLVSEIIQAALARQASDIHIEPQAADTAVRLRVDGVLRDLRRVPRKLQNSLISRLKILSDMDIAERRAPQDGRFMVVANKRKMDMRVSTLPTQYGEKVVMRLLESEGPVVSFSQLGFPGPIEAGLNHLLELPQGMLLVTGPTGSGKSTTLYAALHRVRKPSVNIVTVEDPIEYVLPGINQVHVNARAGLTFASCLRSILRQDPNVIMIGEIRDRETAEIAMKAAQTGHLVLSTLHTNDSVSAIVRLLDLEIRPYLMAASLTGILAQRLVRKLCKCSTQVPAGTEFLTQMAAVTGCEPPTSEYRAVGCAVCEGTGFKGRVGVYELLSVDEPVRAAIRDGRIDIVQEAARAQGMKLMQEDALEKVRAGVTTLGEVRRVVTFESAPAAKCQACGQPQTAASRFCPLCGAPRQDHSGPERLPDTKESVLAR
jgi:type IV pilus assembly protein PilB